MSATRLFFFAQVSLATVIYAEEPPRRGSVSIQVQALEDLHPASPLEVRTDKEACGKLRSPQSVILNKERYLKNVVVWLEGPHVNLWSKKDDRAEFIQEEQCEFSPRIVIVPPETPVSLFNRDNVIHGLRTKGQANPPTNRVHPPNLNEVKLKFAKPEIVPIACDFHPWMKAFVVVAPHADYGITDESGRWTFKKVVAGTYEVKLWHEILGFRTLSDKVTVESNPINLNITWGLATSNPPQEKSPIKK